MEEMAKESGALPYLMLRANDWVKPVREKAFFLLNRYIASCSVEEILFSMPVLEKLESSSFSIISSQYVFRLSPKIILLLQSILLSKPRHPIPVKNWSP